MEQSSIPKGFSAEEWALALASGKVMVVNTKPRPPKLVRIVAAPIQFLKWTIAARVTTPDAAPHKWDRALPFVR